MERLVEMKIRIRAQRDMDEVGDIGDRIYYCSIGEGVDPLAPVYRLPVRMRIVQSMDSECLTNYCLLL